MYRNQLGSIDFRGLKLPTLLGANEEYRCANNGHRCSRNQVPEPCSFA